MGTTSFFFILDVNSKNNVLTLCSPSRHVLVFTEIGPALQLPLEVQDILYKITDVKKVALFKDIVDKLFDNNGMDRISIVDLHPVAKKNVEFWYSELLQTATWQRLFDKGGV